MGGDRATRSKAPIPVAWTFMSEILTKHRHIIERHEKNQNLGFDSASWACAGHECPSYSNRSDQLSMLLFNWYWTAWMTRPISLSL